jgi:hypothetical protein
MSNTKRIVIITLIFIGGTSIFASWAYYNFNLAFSDIDKLLVTKTDNKASALSYKFGTTTPAQTPVVATTSPKTEALEFEFTFPTKAVDLYEGCKYKIEWTSSQKIDSISISLLDAGTRESMGPNTAGIPKTITGDDLNSYEWKVGKVWPGEYLLLATELNGQKINERSYKFIINEIPAGSDLDTVCKL